MHTRSVTALLALAACATAPQAPKTAATAASSQAPTTAAAAASPQRGVEAGDLDRSADPCGDFFQFANGSWRAANPIPQSMQRWSRRWQAGEANKDQLRSILEELSRREWPAGSVEQLVSDHYASCMDEARVDAAGLGPLAPLLAGIDAAKGPADVQRLIRTLQGLEVAVPFGLQAASDNHEPTRVLANVFAAGLGLPDRDYYVKTEPRFIEAREKNRAHIAAMLSLAGLSPEAARSSAKAVFAFETRLAEASLDNVSLRNPSLTDHKTTFAQLAALTPHFDWTAFFDEARLPRGDLNVSEPGFLLAVERELLHTPVAEWREYLKWQLIESAAPWLSKPFVDEWFAFNQAYLGGVKEMKPRWKRCAESTDELFGEALGRKYVERYFPPAAKARAQELVKNVLAAMGDTVNGLQWMGPETKRKALEKLATFNPKIGYPDKWKDYSKVQVGRASFWANVVAGRRFNVEDDRATIGKPVDRARWGMTPPTSNAYYNPLLNEIVFPAGILQPPAFSLEATDAVNYGAIGVVIGHEVSHGFDDQGAQFDAQGRLQNWWTEADLGEFRKRAQCVVDQFDGYFIEPGIHHNGKLVLGESIGDLAGARIAYLAFRKALESRPVAGQSMNGFTPEQEFFVAWGQFRGDEIRPETQRLMVQGDPHPIGKYRVIGPLSNLPEFQRAFACKAGAAMVRPAASRCQIW